MIPAAGTAIRGFVLEALLGRGASAQVWRATHATSGVPVAVKIAHSAADRALRREAVHLAALDHPGVVFAFDAGSWQGRPWLALELAAGTLAAAPPPVPLGDLARHLLDALAFLHARDIVHCDLKPSNILVGCAPHTGLDPADRAGIRIADFGIAWGGGAASTAGTRGWMAPEQQHAPDQIGPATDLYALALVLGSLASPEEQAALAPWMATALSASPADRFPTAAHAQAALPDLRHCAPAPRAAQPSAETMTAPVTGRLPLAAPPRRPRRCAPLPWPAAPPHRPARRMRARIREAGRGLLSHRPAPLVGRDALLSALWAALRDGPVTLTGAAEDVAEVAGALRLWARQAGCPPRVAAGPGGTPVPPLVAWQLEARARALGFSPASATLLAATCGGSWRRLHARIRSLDAANLLDDSDDGFVVRGRLAAPRTALSPDQLAAALEACFRRNDAIGHATLYAELVLAAPDTPRAPFVRALHTARLATSKDPRDGAALIETARAAGDAGFPDLARALRLSAASLYIRARAPREALAVLDRIPGHPADAWIDSKVRRFRAHALFSLRDPGLEDALSALSAPEERWLQSALRADQALMAGRPADAVPHARQSLAAAQHPGCTLADRVLAAHALINALAATEAPEDEIAPLLDEIQRAEPELLDRGLIARSTLLRAQAAMRREDWDAADRLLARAQQLYRQARGSAVFVVLNHGVVGLRRADLASIAAITPPDWLHQTRTAPPYVQPLMRLHAVLAALGSGDLPQAHAHIDTLAQAVLPHAAAPNLALAADLAPDEIADRLRALIG